jgi:beta-glucanase (GH16 family)
MGTRALRRAAAVVLAGAAVAGCLHPPRPVTGGRAWRVVFADEFTRLDPTRWNYRDNTMMSTNGVENTFRAANVTVRDGTLRLTARRDPDGSITSGLVMTSNVIGGRVTFKYTQGYIETRARLPKGDAFWPAFWLNYPGDGSTPTWPDAGEMDIQEWYGRTPRFAESNFHFSDGGADASIGAVKHDVGSITDWHVYGLNWTPTQLQWFIDGKRVRTYTARTASQRQALGYAHSIILNLAVGGMEWTGYRRGTADRWLPGTAEFDYVRVWQP